LVWRKSEKGGRGKSRLKASGGGGGEAITSRISVLKKKTSNKGRFRKPSVAHQRSSNAGEFNEDGGNLKRGQCK